MEDNDAAGTIRIDRLYWAVSLVILFVCLIVLLYTTHLFLRSRKHLHQIHIAIFFLLISDYVTVINYLPQDIYQLVTNITIKGEACIFSGFVTMASTVSISCSAVMVAYTTYQTVNNYEIQKKAFLRFFLFQWIFGFTFSSYFLATNKLGLFEGLYCNTKSNSEPTVSIPFLLMLLVVIALMFYFFAQAVLKTMRVDMMVSMYARQSSNLGLATRNMSVDSRNETNIAIKEAFHESMNETHHHGQKTYEEPQTNARLSASNHRTQSPKNSTLILRLGVRVTTLLFLCWILIVLNALLETLGADVSIWSHVFGAWIVKLQPICDSIHLTLLLRRAQAHW